MKLTTIKRVLRILLFLPLPFTLYPSPSALSADWQMGITFSVADPIGGRAVQPLTAGMRVTALDGFDSTLDAIAFGGGTLSAYFYHPSDPGHEHLARDFRFSSYPKQWDIYVSGSGDQAGPFTYVSPTQFSVPGDQLALYQANRRLKVVVGAGTLYGTITSAAFAAGETAVTVSLDSGSLDAGLSAVSVDAEVAMGWTLPQTAMGACLGLALTMTDVTTGLPVNLLLGSYTYLNSVSGPRHFQFTASQVVETPPQQPGNLFSPRVGTTSVLLAWTKAVGTVAGYHVYRKAPGAAGYTRRTVAPVTTPKYIDTDAPPGTYSYLVTTTSSTGCESSPSNELVVKVGQ